MPNFIARWNHVQNIRDRLHKVADALLSYDDDILILQEAFHMRAASELKAKLQSKYPYIIYNVRYTLRGLCAGIMICSKYPMEIPKVPFRFETIDCQLEQPCSPHLI